MPSLYPHDYSSDGHGSWWGIRCPSSMYTSMFNRLEESDRCFVYITNSRGDTLAIAVESPHSDDADVIFAPDWVLSKLGIDEGDMVLVDPITEKLPNAELVRLQPLTVATVENPIFIEGLTEALNQLGVIQEGFLSAIVDPSMPELHDFLVDKLNPAKVCLANGDLNVEMVSAIDYSEPEPEYIATVRPDTPTPDLSTSPIMPFIPTSGNLPSLFVPFSGKGYSMSSMPKRNS